MARKPRPNLRDNLVGYGRSLRNGTAMNPIATTKEVRRAMAERLRREGFGTGEDGMGGDRNWTPPVHALDDRGRPVTVSFGRGSRRNDTLICDGHVSFEEFYRSRRDGRKGHDHYTPLGDSAPGDDRGRYGIE